MNIKVANVAEYINKINKISDVLVKREPLLNKIGEMFVSSTVERFTKEQAPDGTPWTKSLRALHEGGQTLSDTGRLKTSIEHKVEGNSVYIGTNIEYAPTHQFGANIKPVNAKALKFFLPGIGFVQVKKVVVPARPFLGVSEKDKKDLKAVIKRFFKV